MPNTLLEDIKTLGYSHEEVLKFLKDKKEAEGKENEEGEEEEEQEEEEQPEGKEKDKKKDKDKSKTLDIDITKLSADITKSVSTTVSKAVSEEIKKQIGLLRGNAPKGEKGDAPLNNDFFVKKNLYEKIV